MNDETKIAVTDPLLEEFVLEREEADTKPKINSVHILNDVSATIGKIKCEVRSHNPVNGHLMHIK